MVTEATQVMEQVHGERHLPYQRLCALAEVPYSSFMRRHRRRRQHLPVLAKPGPQKTEFDLRPLLERIRELRPGPHRCPGTGALFAEYQAGISRRDGRELVQEVRRDLRHQDLAAMTRITWHYPGTVWAVDDLHVGHTADGGLLWSTTVTDLASCYRFPVPLLGTPANGEELAGHLARLFARYGAPLVIKQDNAGNLNHPMVAEVCAAYGVLRLTSPAQYPRFNGGIEHSQGEIRGGVRKLDGRDRNLPLEPGLDRNLPLEHAPAYLTGAYHDLNHKPRRQLQKKTACQVFTDPAYRIKLTRRTRKELHTRIDQLTANFLRTIVKPTAWQLALARRQAIEAVLQEEGYFSVQIARKVLPTFLTRLVS